MSSTKWETGSSVTSITSAADLTTGNTLLSAAYDNTSGGTNNFLMADFELDLPNGLGAALTAEQAVELYILPALDGTNYMDFDTNFTDVLAPAKNFVGSFAVRAESTASTAQRLAIMDCPIPPYSFKVGIRNSTGQTLKDGASHFTVKMFPKRLQNV